MVERQVDATCVLTWNDPFGEPSDETFLPDLQDCWISKAHNFHCNLSLSLDKSLSVSDVQVASVLRCIGETVETAELWEQLSLKAFIDNESAGHNDSMGTCTKQLSLSIHNHLDVGPFAACSRVEPNTTPELSNLRAPDTIQSPHMVSFQLIIHLSPLDNHKSKAAGLDVIPRGMPDRLSQESYGPASDYRCPTAFQRDVLHRGCLDLRKDEQSRNIKLFQDHAVAAPLLQESSNKQEVTRRNKPSEALYSISQSLPWPITSPGPGKRLHTEYHASRSVVTAAAVIPLFDSGFRQVICPRPIRTFPGVKTSEDSNRTYLAGLAPLIFVPGYAVHVADRADLIPGIAKFLSAYSKTRSASARQQCSLVRKPRVSTESGDMLFPRLTEAADVKEALKARLWLTLTNALRNVEPARRLKPLRISPDSGAIPLLPSAVEDTLDKIDARETHARYDNDEMEKEEMLMNLGLSVDDPEGESLFDLYDTYRAHNPAAPNTLTHFDAISPCSAISEAEHTKLGAISSLPDTTILTRRGTGAADSDNQSLSRAQIFTNGISNREGALEHEQVVAPYYTDSEKAVDTMFWRNSVGAFEDVIGVDQLLTEHAIRFDPEQPIVTQQRHDSLLPMFNMVIDHGEHESTPFERLSIESSDDESFEAVKPTCQASRNWEERLLLDIDMASDDQSNRLSLSDIVGRDNLLWQMWTKRPIMAPTEFEALEMQAIYSRNPDMKLLNSERMDENIREDEEMLDEDVSTNASNSPIMSPGSGKDRLSYLESPHTNQDVYGSAVVTTTAPTSPKHHFSRGHSFLKRLSRTLTTSKQYGGQVRVDGPVNAESREMQIKRRKILEDYNTRQVDDEMLLG